MDVSGQFHAAAALTPGEEPTVATGLGAGWSPEPVWTQRWNGEKSLLLSRIEPRLSGP
jgi:hypothetical protein